MTLLQVEQNCWEKPIGQIPVCVLERGQEDFYGALLFGVILVLGFYLRFFIIVPEKIRLRRDLLNAYAEAIKEKFGMGYVSCRLVLRNRQLRREIIIFSRIEEQELHLRSALKRRKVADHKVEDLTPFFELLVNVLRGNSDFRDKANELERHLNGRLKSSTVISISESKTAESDGAQTASDSEWSGLLKEVLLEAIPAQLSCIDIFEKDMVLATLTKLQRNPSFKDRIRTSLGIDKLPSGPTGLKYAAALHGILDKEDRRILQNEKINIVQAPTLMGSAALFFYLRDIEEFNMELNFGVSHSVEILSKIENRVISPEACVIGDAQYLYIRNGMLKPAYNILSVMPKDMNYVVAPNIKDYRYSKDSMKEGDYRILKDEKYVSTVQFAHEYYKQMGLIASNNEPKNLEPADALWDLQEADPDKRHFLWSLQRLVAEKLGIGVRIDDIGHTWDTFLICKRGFMREKSGKQAASLSKAVRHAWIKMYRNEKLTARVVDLMLADPEYLENSRRISGIARLGIH
jgi:hypothetical protein